ncbi:MAG: GYD domain-containing protein [Anaerolineales bacterium]
METYIILGNYTQDGVRKIKESPARIEAARKATEAAGGKFLSWHLTMGRYDFVVITEAPDAKTAASVLLAIGAQGDSRTETLRALTEEEFKEVVAAMPL